MPSFDIVSEVDMHELTNAVDNANRAISQRFDFKGTETNVQPSKEEITLTSESEFQVQQVLDIMQKELIRRKVDIKSLEEGKLIPNGKLMQQKLLIRQGIDKENTKKIVKLIKQKKLKVQASTAWPDYVFDITYGVAELVTYRRQFHPNYAYFRILHYICRL